VPLKRKPSQPGLKPPRFLPRFFVGLKAHASTGRQIQTQRRTSEAVREARASEMRPTGRQVGRYECKSKSNCERAGRVPALLKPRRPTTRRVGRYETPCKRANEAPFGCAPFLRQGKEGKQGNPALQMREQRRCARITCRAGRRTRIWSRGRLRFPPTGGRNAHQ
jgi:hypothetical protein